MPLLANVSSAKAAAHVIATTRRVRSVRILNAIIFTERTYIERERKGKTNPRVRKQVSINFLSTDPGAIFRKLLVLQRFLRLWRAPVVRKRDSFDGTSCVKESEKKEIDGESSEVTVDKHLQVKAGSHCGPIRQISLRT